jgi:hypothetical protein
MTNSEARIIHLEQLLAANADALLRLQQQVAALAQAVRTAQSAPYGGGGGGGLVFFINPVVISSGGSVTGVTIYANVGGTLTATSQTNATVWNMMASATVSTSGKYIVVGLNPDQTYSVITQSC